MHLTGCFIRHEIGRGAGIGAMGLALLCPQMREPFAEESHAQARRIPKPDMPGWLSEQVSLQIVRPMRFEREPGVLAA